MTISLTFACSAYDRTEALRDGRVRVPGVDLTYLDMTVEEIFFRMARFREFDACEMSLGSYVVNHSRDRAFIALPVFPSRMFRHSGIYVNRDAGIEVPKDLLGKQVGVAEYQLTANVWIRGILADGHGVPIDAVTYRTGGLHAPGRVEKLSVDVPESVRVTPIGPNQSLSQMLADGEIDALYTPRAPDCFADGDPRVGRLFTDSRAAEEQYYAETGIFPIMHVVVLRRDVYERNRWLARSFYVALEQARQSAVAAMGETAALRYLLPWLHDEVSRTRAVLGADYWTYGLEQNKGVLATFLRYAHDQGLTPDLVQPAELFAPETLETFVV